jgi:hypothetical protein
MPETELTITDVLADLASRGFVADFRVGGPPAALICGACGHHTDPHDAEVVELFRFEGASDPSDEAVVVAIRCQVCGALGTLVAAYGSLADGAEADVLAALVDRRPGRGATG